MRLHLVALPHTQTTAAYSSCAYTQKVVKFAKMMRRQGCYVTLYGSEVNDAECDEHVVMVPEAERAAVFGDAFDTVLTPFLWDATQPYWRDANARAISAIRDRAQLGDLVCLTTGWPQKPIADALPDLISCEWAVGYEGIFTSYRAFESSAWMHHVYGLNQQRLGHWYDTVIPNCFDREDFPRLGQGGGGYLMFLGRLIERKGPHVALQIAERLGKRLIVAGPGAIEHGPGFVRSADVELRGNVEYVGELRPRERARYLEEAEVLLCPTLYVEPFGGAAVEAMLTGTPVVASDFGAFIETVEPGITGYRFHTLAEGAAAVTRALTLDRASVRARALERFSLEAVGPQFTRWLDRLQLWATDWAA